MKSFRIFILPLLTLFSACAVASSAAPPAQWSRSVTCAITNAEIYRDVVIFGIDKRPWGGTRTEAYQVRTGKPIWQRAGALPLRGSSFFLTYGTAVERIEPLSGRPIWHSIVPCNALAARGPSAPNYVAVIGRTAYVGCNGGTIVGLLFSNG